MKFVTPVLLVVLALFGLGLTPTSALAAVPDVHNGEKLCNSGASDAWITVYADGVRGGKRGALLEAGDCYTLNAGDYDPSLLRVEIIEPSFRVRNDATSGPYGKCQSTGSDKDEILHPGDHDRVTFLEYGHSNCKHKNI